MDVFPGILQVASRWAQYLNVCISPNLTVWLCLTLPLARPSVCHVRDSGNVSTVVVLILDKAVWKRNTRKKGALADHHLELI